jgi:hypothetical protein
VTPPTRITATPVSTPTDPWVAVEDAVIVVVILCRSPEYELMVCKAYVPITVLSDWEAVTVARVGGEIVEFKFTPISLISYKNEAVEI